MQNRFSRSEIKVMQLAIFIMCLGIVIFFVTAKTLLIPAIRSNTFKYTTCKVVGRRLVIQRGSKTNKVFSDCENEEFKDYPCSQTLVQYNFPFLLESHNENSQYHEQKPDFQLKEKDHTLVLQQNAVLYMSDIDLLYTDQSSYHPYCSRDFDVMANKVALFHGRIRFPGTTFQCLYDPKNPAVTIMFRTFTKWSIFHSVFWPFVFVFVGLLILFVVYCWIGNIKKMMMKAKNDQKEKSLSRLQQEAERCSSVKKRNRRVSFILEGQH